VVKAAVEMAVLLTALTAHPLVVAVLVAVLVTEHRAMAVPV
jgi:hypothetical protein